MTNTTKSQVNPNFQTPKKGKYIKTELLEGDIKEAQEIINILSAIINKTKTK
ncbi:MAG: hypothetical protein ISS94_02500 [Candidatus Syntrophoarchaeum sp.]|nr:hypothetical protein [Candidatus Syntrophoarchaeum sp.]